MSYVLRRTTFGLFGVIGFMSMGQAFANTFVTVSSQAQFPYGGNATTLQSVTATCPTGYTVVSGGYYTNPFSMPVAYIDYQNQTNVFMTSEFVIAINAPTSTGNGWTVAGLANANAPMWLTVNAVCASAT
jgi:hypothetical protein